MAPKFMKVSAKYRIHHRPTSPFHETLESLTCSSVCVCVCMEGQTVGWMDGWMGGWTDGRTDGWNQSIGSLSIMCASVQTVTVSWQTVAG